ncbi:MAG: hypothetical protein WCD86_12430, partial [Ktedonobacteraceae bacterium]
GMGREAREAENNLKLVPVIERVMGDIKLRREEAKAARLSPAASQQPSPPQQRQARLVAFAEELAKREQKGYLEEPEVDGLIAAYKDVLSENEINQQIKVEVRPARPDHDMSSIMEILDAATLRDIDERLAVVHKENLYQLLGQATTAQQTVLCREAERLLDTMMRRQPKNEEVTAYTRLAGHAATIFGDTGKRTYYDEYLRRRIEQANGNIAGTSNFALPQRNTIERLKAQNIGTALRLTWLWPSKCYEVCVFYSDKGWPQPLHGREPGISVTLAGYEAAGHFDLHAPPNQHYYIVVVPIIAAEGGPVATRGARVEGDLIPQISIQYEIKNPRFGYKQRTLHLYTPKTPVMIPATLVLLYRNDIRPLHKNDGRLLYQITGPIEMSLPERLFPLPDTRFPRNTYAKLFLEDDSLNTLVIIYHPDERKLRLD